MSGHSELINSGGEEAMTFYRLHADGQGNVTGLESIDPANVRILRAPDGSIYRYEVSEPLGIETDDENWPDGEY